MATKKNELAEALFQLAQFIQSGDYLKDPDEQHFIQRYWK